MINVNAKIFRLDNNMYKPKYSIAGLISFGISVYIIFNFILAVIIALNIDSDSTSKNGFLQFFFLLIGIGVLLTPFTSAMALLFGIIGKTIIYNSAGIKKGYVFTQIGFLTGLIIFTIFILLLITYNIANSIYMNFKWIFDILRFLSYVFPGIGMAI